MAIDYTTVTEVPGALASAEQLSMLYTRYHLAAEFSAGKDVLEVACGRGQGLGYLERRAKRVVGGDYTESLLRAAQRWYGGRVPLVRLDAHRLPFAKASFDVVILHEAIYYLARPEEFVDEALRVLRPGGELVICSANREWSGFNPSPFSTRYLSAQQLRELLASRGLEAKVFGAFPVTVSGFRQKATARIREAAVRWHLIPKTMKGKALLKRLFYGRLTRIENEVREGMGDVAPLHPIAEWEEQPQYKVIYALGRVGAPVRAAAGQERVLVREG